MGYLSLSLLGPFQVTLAGQPLSGFESNRVRALFAYLAVEAERPHSRDALAGLLWPDWPQQTATANLRKALASLRKTIGDPRADLPYLLISHEMIQFNTASDHTLDVAAFTSLLKGNRGDREVVAHWQHAVALVRGMFLEGFVLGDSPAFESWVTLQREQLSRQLLEVLGRLASYYERCGECEQARDYAQRQVDLDPTQEEGQRQLMRALALGGQRSAALAQYQSCRRVLAEEMGVEPARETVTLYETIRQGTLVGPLSLLPRPGLAEGEGPFAADSALISVRASSTPKLGEVPEAGRPFFVAREEELGQLDRWLGMALSGQGRAGFVVGEPGSGKTLLVREFARQAMEAYPELVVTWGNCNAYSGLGDPYLPFLEILEMLTADIEGQRAAGGIGREQARRLRRVLPTVVQSLLDHGPGLIEILLPGAGLLARALALAQGPTAWLIRLQELLSCRAFASGGGIQSQSDLFQQVTRVLQAVAREHPLLLVLEDLQWADAGSIALLFHLGRRLEGSRILVLGAYRPEEVAQGREGQRHPLEMVLNEFGRTWGESQVDLAQAEGRRFVGALVDSEPNRLGTRFREALHRHTGGHALFTVELLRGLQERGDLARDETGYWIEGPQLNWEQLPRRVEATIAERIGRLPREWQELLSVASVEGEEFTAEVLARVLGTDEQEVLRLLSGPLSEGYRLVGAQGLRRQGEQRLSRYRFRHFLFQHYLYQHLDEVRRGVLHERVGLALESLYGATPRPFSLETRGMQWWNGGWRKFVTPRWWDTASVAPELARHFRAAGLTQKAVLCLHQASERAWLLCASEEARSHVIAALELLATLPPTPERSQQECVMQGGLGLGIFLEEGPGPVFPAVGQAFARSVELAEQVGDLPLLCLNLRHLADYHRMAGEPRQALGLGERALHLAQSQQEPLPAAMRSGLGQTSILCGDFLAACAHLEPMIAASLGPQPHVPRFRTLYLNVLTWVPWALWCRGYPEQALKVGRAALAMSKTWQGPFYIVLSLSEGLCFTQQLCRDLGALQCTLGELLPLAGKESCQPRLRPYATLFAGWAHAQGGLLEQGIEELRRGLEEWSACYGMLRPHWQGYLAEALARAGRVEEGFATVAEALEQAERTGEGFSLAELYRLKGELLLQRGVPGGEAETEACFQKAIEVAQGQGARSWELRATMSLARLWQRQSKREEARQVLSAIYGWFTEGFDTPDLQEAGALLAALSAAAVGTLEEG